ncbi:MAG: hypothetical protein DRQ55_08985 [Planctomycetota bacterium]|nr:MAG: hypothetical protein DRQ55_08985 [Planctomycetota bacterium]
MPSPADERAAHGHTAETLFESFLARHDDPQHPAFAQLCEAHPAQAQNLRQLAADWSRMAHLVDALGDDSKQRPPARLSASGSLPPHATPLDTTRALPGSGGSASPPMSGAGSADSSASVQGTLDRLSVEASGFARYRVRREIDHGGMGRILRVWDGTLRRPLAMKVMLDGTSTSGSRAPADERKLSRFLEEAQITGQLDHPGVVPVHELGLDDNGHLYFTMRLVRGRSLRTIFELVHDGLEGWTVARALGVLQKVCEALAYAHSKNVIHRDIKPANIMVGRFGETYVMDWGLAKVLGAEDSFTPAHDPEHDIPSDDQSDGGDGSIEVLLTDRAELERCEPESPLMTIDGTVVGTPAYMSPEQADGRLDDVGPHSDVYAVGALLYHLLAGRMPYVEAGQRGEPQSVLEAVRSGPPQRLSSIAPRAPLELAAICERAMARDISARYADMGEMAKELRAFLEGRVVRSYEAGAWAQLRKWIVRNKASAAGTLFALLLLAGALGWALYERDRFMAQGDSERAARTRAEDAEASARDAEQVAQDNEREALLAMTAAERSQAQAERSQAEAERAQAAEAAAADRVRSTSYMAFVNAANGHLSHGELDAARRLLAACPPDLRGWEWGLAELRRDSSLAQLSGHAAGVSATAFVAGSSLLASAGRDGSLRLWDTTSFAPLASIDLGQGLAQALAVHPDGRTLAVAVSLWGQPSEVRRYDISSGQALSPLSVAPSEPGGNETILALAFNPAGTRLFGATDERRIVWWSLSDPRPRAFPQRHGGRVTSLAFDDTGLRLVSGSSDRRAIVWDVSSGTQEVELGPHDGAVLSVAHASGSHRVATGSADGLVRVFDLDQGERPLFLLDGHDGAVTSLSFSADGARLISASDDRSVRVWDAWTGAALAELLGHEAPVNAVAVADNGQLLASASDDGSLRLWDASWLGERVLLAGHAEAVVSVATPARGELAATSSYDGSVRLWDLTTQLPMSTRDLPAPLGASLAFSPDGSLLAVGEPASERDGRHVIALWDTSRGRFPEREPLRLSGHSARIAALAFSPDGALLASGSIDGTVALWDAATGARVGGHETHAGWVLSLAFHPSEPLLASGASDDLLVLHDLANDRTAWVMDDLAAPAQALAFGHDGRALAVASGRVVRLLDLPDRSWAAELSGHQDDLLDLAWHPRQQRLASSSRDGTIRLWDTDSAMALLTLRPGSPALALSFDAAGGRLLSTQGSDLVSWETSPPSRTWDQRRARAEVMDLADASFKRLLDELVDPREVVAALEADRELAPAVRSEALRLASNFGQHPWRLAESAWTLLVDRRATPVERATALRRARAAVRLAPDEPRLQNVLALAWHRAGDPESAIDWAQRAETANRESRRYPSSWDLFVLSLAHEAMGLHTVANAYFEAGEAERLDESGDDDVSAALAIEARNALR